MSLLPGICAVAFFATADLAAAKEKEWVTLQNCQLVPNRANDGDSFHIRADNSEYLIRLYFVDAPETGGVGSPERLIQQAEYFGVSVPEVIEIGKDAKAFVEAKLAEPFTVVTRMAEGLGHSNITRILGFVRTKDGDLGEQLVANGLARIHGTKTAPPGAANAQVEIQKLESLEQDAKQKKLGGWGATSAKTANSPEPPGKVSPTTPIAQQPPKPSTPPPTRPPLTIAATPVASASLVSPVQQSAKVDVNTATKDQLEKIPGIGPTLAERIIAARPFKSADDLKNVKGIGGEKRYQQIRPYFN